LSTPSGTSRYIISRHASRRLRERGATGWQVVDATVNGHIAMRQPDAKPNPTVEFRVILADGSGWRAVWSWLGVSRTAKLVTVYPSER